MERQREREYESEYEIGLFFILTLNEENRNHLINAYKWHDVFIFPPFVRVCVCMCVHSLPYIVLQKLSIYHSKCLSNFSRSRYVYNRPIQRYLIEDLFQFINHVIIQYFFSYYYYTHRTSKISTYICRHKNMVCAPRFVGAIRNCGINFFPMISFFSHINIIQYGIYDPK